MTELSPREAEELQRLQELRMAIGPSLVKNPTITVIYARQGWSWDDYLRMSVRWLNLAQRVTSFRTENTRLWLQSAAEDLQRLNLSID